MYKSCNAWLAVPSAEFDHLYLDHVAFSGSFGSSQSSVQLQMSRDMMEMSNHDHSGRIQVLWSRAEQVLVWNCLNSWTFLISIRSSHLIISLFRS